MAFCILQRLIEEGAKSEVFQLAQGNESRSLAVIVHDTIYIRYVHPSFLLNTR